MPNLMELLGIAIVILVIWVVLKMAQVAIRLILLIVGLLFIAGVLYYFFAR